MVNHLMQGGTPLQFFSVRPAVERAFFPVQRGAQHLTPTTIMKFFAFSIAFTKVVKNPVKMVGTGP